MVQVQYIKEIVDGIGVSVVEYYIDVGDWMCWVEFMCCFRQWCEIFLCILWMGIWFVGNILYYYVWVVFVMCYQFFNCL